jgi:uncharacterized protein (DUF4213/DUF364 family)
MNLLDDLVHQFHEEYTVRDVYTCVHWTAVVTKHCGLASTFHSEHPGHKAVRGTGELRGKPALELVQYAKSDNLLEASIGMATINSLIDVDETRCTEANALDILISKGQGKNIAVVGHFPWIPKVEAVAKKFWVLEQRPIPGDLPAEMAETILPQADVVAITGTSLINHTIEHLLKLCQQSFIVMVGPTSPLTPILFDWGIDVISGTLVSEPEKVIHYISEGATFQQVKGVKLLTMAK